MAPRLPKAGDSYEYVGEPIGNDPGRVNTGTVMTVREVVDAGEIGAYDETADSVVLEWTEPAVGYDEDNQPIIIGAPRAWSVAVGEFSDLFKKVT